MVLAKIILGPLFLRGLSQAVAVYARLGQLDGAFLSIQLDLERGKNLIGAAVSPHECSILVALLIEHLFLLQTQLLCKPPAEPA